MSRARSRRAILLVFVGAIFSGFAFVPSLREPVRDALREVVGFRRVEQYSRVGASRAIIEGGGAARFQ